MRYEPHVCLTGDALIRLLNNNGPDFAEQWELPVCVKLSPGVGKVFVVFVSPLLLSYLQGRVQNGKSTNPSTFLCIFLYINAEWIVFNEVVLIITSPVYNIHSMYNICLCFWSKGAKEGQLGHCEYIVLYMYIIFILYM